MGWLLTWQQSGFADGLPPDQKARFYKTIGPLIADNFIKPPSSGPAFLQLTAAFFEELAHNTTRLPLLEKLDIPVKVIWGEFDSYITVAVAKDRASHFKNASLTILPAGHWLQSDMPAEVAAAMLA
jgi:haloalkane dehalogenase